MYYTPKRYLRLGQLSLRDAYRVKPVKSTYNDAMLILLSYSTVNSNLHINLCLMPLYSLVVSCVINGNVQLGLNIN